MGIQKMRETMTAAGLREPEFETDGFFRTVLHRPERGGVGIRQTPGLGRTTQSTDPVVRLLTLLQRGASSTKELLSALGIKHKPTFRANYLHPALQAGLIEYTIPDKPNSRLQKYRITPAGERVLKSGVEKDE